VFSKRMLMYVYQNPTIQQLIARKTLSIYLLCASLIFSGCLMRPGVAILLMAIPINAAILVALRWAAHCEGEQF